VLGRQHHLGLGQVRGRATQLDHQLEQALDGCQDFQILLLAVDVFLRDAQVLELADGVVWRSDSVNFFSESAGRASLWLLLRAAGSGPKTELALLQVGSGA
jgi:hypothetical protein